MIVSVSCINCGYGEERTINLNFTHNTSDSSWVIVFDGN